MPAPISFAPPECPLILQRYGPVSMLLTLQAIDPGTLEPTGDVADLTGVTSIRAVLRRGRDPKLPADVTFDAEVVAPPEAGTIRVQATADDMLRVVAGDGYVIGVRSEAASGPFAGLGWIVGDVVVAETMFGPAS